MIVLAVAQGDALQNSSMLAVHAAVQASSTALMHYHYKTSAPALYHNACAVNDAAVAVKVSILTIRLQAATTTITATALGTTCASIWYVTPTLHMRSLSVSAAVNTMLLITKHQHLG
jgi:hypothetical protein